LIKLVIKLLVFILLTTEFCNAQQDSTVKQEFPLTALGKVKISAYTQFRYQDFGEPNKPDGFDLRRARIDLKGKLNNNWEYRLQTEFGGGTTKLVDATLKYNYSSKLIFTVGQFKIPFSSENLTPSSRLEFINRSTVTEALVARGKDISGNQLGRDIGAQVNGSFFKLKDFTLIDYALAIFNGQGINSSDLNSQKDLAGRILIQPIKGLKAGGSCYIGYDKIGKDSTASNKVRNRFGFEASYVRSRLVFQGEYMMGTDGNVDRNGYYFFTGYTFAKKKLQAIVKYEYYDTNKNNGNDAITAYTGGLNCFVNDNIKLAANYEIHNEEGQSLNNDLFSLQFQIQF
jgi:phosphate-selective porin OprO and OprP